MKTTLGLLMLLTVGTQSMAADWRCVAVRGVGADEHTFEVEGLLIRGHEGTGTNRAKAISNASNDCLNSGHLRCKVVSCSAIEQNEEATESDSQE